MAKTLKAYTVPSGFFELAVAAPSMKAALAAWEMKHNAFHQGIAKETRDSKIVAATKAKPGVVLRRAIGSNGEFSESPKLPNVPKGKAPAKLKPDRRAIQQAKTALSTAETQFDRRMSKLERQRSDLDGQITKETDKWQKRRSELEEAVELASKPSRSR